MHKPEAVDIYKERVCSGHSRAFWKYELMVVRQQAEDLRKSEPNKIQMWKEELDMKFHP